MADQGRNARFSTSHRTMTAWMDPGGLCVAAEADAADCEAAGAGGGFALGAGDGFALGAGGGFALGAGGC